MSSPSSPQNQTMDLAIERKNVRVAQFGERLWVNGCCEANGRLPGCLFGDSREDGVNYVWLFCCCVCSYDLDCGIHCCGRYLCYKCEGFKPACNCNSIYYQLCNVTR